MTSAHIDHRVTTLETRVTDIEDTYGDAIYDLKREVTGVKIIGGQLIDGVNELGRGIGLMMAQMKLPPLNFIELKMPSEAEIDAALDADC
ncbi:hypothetical protein OG203_19565 [Nocardia sp. NBC_01499]|uniref:hypothetical protein n=1 Tax=Nocardia sp. NBC_01499 TaxID=2903597 RepID=UPI003866FC04